MGNQLYVRGLIICMLLAIPKPTQDFSTTVSKMYERQAVATKPRPSPNYKVDKVLLNKHF